jgi:putative endonuclease
MYFVYIIRCKGGALYTGITGNIRKRLSEHSVGMVPFTKNRKPVKLVFYEIFNSRISAAKREKEIKGWRREKKEDLIKKFTLNKS